MNHILVVGQTPPPYHGQAIAIHALTQAHFTGCTLDHLRMEFSKTETEIGSLSLRKIRHLLALIRSARNYLRQHPHTTLYYPPAGGALIPILRDICFLLCVRPLAAATVFHFHAAGLSDYLKRHPLLAFIALRAYRRPDLAIRLLPSAPDDGTFLRARKSIVVPNGQEVPPIRRLRDPADQRLHLLYVGLHRESKGIRVLLQTAVELRRRGVCFHIDTVGAWQPDSEQEACAALIAEHSLTDLVTFHGVLSGNAKWNLYGNADAFVFPSFYEHEIMPLVLLEAMACALPIAAASWRCVRDIVQHNVNGLLFAPRDPTAAANTIEQLLAPNLRSRLGAEGRRIYEQKFTMAVHLKNMNNALASIIPKPTSA